MKVALRTDASMRIGTGHLMRCLTLADALRSAGARTRFVCRALPRGLREVVTAGGHELAELPAALATTAGNGDGRVAPVGSQRAQLAHAAWLGATQQEDAAATRDALGENVVWDWLVVDHYAIDARWETRLRAAARRILAIDDLADRRHDCDALLDQNLYAGKHTRYDGLVPEACVRLLGPRYALLRPEFAAARAGLRARGDEVRRVLVFFGGIDERNLTGAALDALDALDAGVGSSAGLGIDVVVGAAHPQREAIVERCAERPRTRCHVQVANMAELIASADVGVGAAGVATWERCALGLPALAVAVAPNQQALLRDAAREGLVLGPDIDGADAAALALHLRALIDNPALRAHLAARGLAAIDALGTGRVVRSMWGQEVAIRPVTGADARDLFEWRNAAEVRRFSRSDAPIVWEDHRRWLAAALADPARVLLVGSVAGSPAGVVRYDLEGDSAEVAIYLAPGQAGRGTGRALLAAAERWLADNRPAIRFVVAEVLSGNAASHRLFAGSGFETVSSRYRKRIAS